MQRRPVEDEAQYEVEAILGLRVKAGVREAFGERGGLVSARQSAARAAVVCGGCAVSWMGYFSWHNSWWVPSPSPSLRLRG